MAVLAMTGQAPEAAAVPPDFALAAAADYPAPGGQRYFLLFIPKAASR
jgi:hypothetical protein